MTGTFTNKLKDKKGKGGELVSLKKSVTLTSSALTGLSELGCAKKKNTFLQAKMPEHFEFNIQIIVASTYLFDNIWLISIGDKRIKPGTGGGVERVFTLHIPLIIFP